jgi:rhamnosyltransferase
MVAAIVILFFPDAELLERLLASLVNQAGRTYLIDNTPDVSERNLGVFAAHNNIEYHPIQDNVGIAKAQNIGIELARKAGFDWFMLLDQDSALPEHMVSQLQQATVQLEAEGLKIATVGPRFRDAKTGEVSAAIRHRLFTVNRIFLTDPTIPAVRSDYVIASGSLIRAHVLDEVGGMMEELFIDYVDVEWGLRAAAHGYQSYIIPSVTMKHSIGDASVQVMGRHINLHSHFRNYHIVRNSAYLLRKSYMTLPWKLVTALKLPQYIVFYAWHSQPRLRNFCSLCKACVDGLVGKLERIIP